MTDLQKCSKCLKTLSLNQFYKDKNKSSGYGSHCKECKNKEIKERQLRYKNINLNKQNITISKICSGCKEIKLNNEFYKSNTLKDGLSQYCKKCNLLNIQRQTNIRKTYKVVIDESIIKKCTVCKINKTLKQYKINLKSNDKFSHICINCSPKNEWTVEKQRASEKKYRDNNPEKMKEKYKKQPNNINRRVRDSLNHRISGSLNANKNRKTNKTIQYIDCEISFLKDWIQYQFQENMSWENYGEWHLDHVKPCASFDLQNEIDIKECFNWKNYQPLWAKDNLIKSNKIDNKLINEHKEKVHKYILNLNSAQLKDGELLEHPESLKYYNVTGNGERECLKNFRIGQSACKLS